MNETMGLDEVSGSVSDLSDGQEMVLALLQLVSGTLSLIGSSTIILKITRNLYKNKASTPYDRIILGLSSCDILISCTHIVSPFLLPRDTSQRVWAMGSESTCRNLGFMAQLSMWGPWYNCLLSFYYLLTVRFQVKRTDFNRKYETWVHLVGAFFFPVTAIIGYICDWYSEMQLSMACWVGEVPKGCGASGTCTGKGNLIAYIFAGIPWAITLLSLIINNMIIYIFVRKSFSPSRKSTTRRSDLRQESRDMTERGLLQQQLTKEVATQGFLYVSFFLMTSTPVLIIQVLDGIGFGEEDQGRLYPLLVLNSLLLPSLGFFNVFIYVRPSYLRFGAANPGKAKWFILRQALFDPDVPRMKSEFINSSGNALNHQNDNVIQSVEIDTKYPISMIPNEYQ